MTDTQLAEIRARCNAATPGNWKHTIPDAVYSVALEDAWPVFPSLEGNGPPLLLAPNVNDAAFAAAARTDIPLLLDEVARLREQVARVEALADRWALLPDVAQPDRFKYIALQGGIDALHQAAQRLREALAEVPASEEPTK